VTKEQERTQVEEEISNLVALGRARMPALGNPLYPCETDWLSPEELATLQALQLRLVLLQDTTTEIRARVAVKRAARRAISPR
jgi:hypothetical protein